MTDWKKYERFVTELCSQEYQNQHTTVIPNAKIRGNLSETIRQIDVLIDSRFGNDRSRRIIVDAKRYSRPINVKDVETFHGMMIDCSASNGVLVCPQGYSKAAKKRAQDYINIRIASLEEVENFDLDAWDDCLSDSCDTKKERGLVLWDSPLGIGTPNTPTSISCTGICDICGDFHVWCWDCGNRFYLTNEDEFKCNCDNPWFWVTAVEEDEDIGTNEDVASSVYLLLCAPTTVLVADRKPLQ